MYEGPRLFQSVADMAGASSRHPKKPAPAPRRVLAMGADVLGAQDGDAPPEVFAAYADEAHKAGKAS